MATEWSNDKVITFLEVLQTEPCLWNPKLKSFKNRGTQRVAWRRIMEKLPFQTTVEEMKKKKDSLMCYYRSHLNKIKKDDLYTTTWFAFETMDKFLRRVYDSSRTLNTENVSLQEEHAECDDEVNAVIRNSENLTPAPPPNLKTINKRAISIDVPSEILHAKKQMQKAFEHVKASVNDEYEIFGKYIASKIRKIGNPNTRDILMNDIHNMVFRSCMMDRVAQQNVQLPQSPEQASQTPSTYPSPKTEPDPLDDSS